LGKRKEETMKKRIVVIDRGKKPEQDSVCCGVLLVLAFP